MSFPAATSALREASRRDVAAARELLSDLLADGRDRHPAIDVLREFAEAAEVPDTLVARARVAFEAGVRVAYGAEFAAAVERGEEPGWAAGLIHARAPMPWEDAAALGVPYREVAWRAAVADAGARLARGDLALPDSVPGAATVQALVAAFPDMDDYLCALLGETPRDEVLDPVVAQGNFLAQAIPGFVDIDMVLRIAREQEVEARRTAAG